MLDDADEESFPEGEVKMKELEKLYVKQLKEQCRRKGIAQIGPKQCLLSVVYGAGSSSSRISQQPKKAQHHACEEKLKISDKIELPDPKSFHWEEWFAEVQSLSMLPEDTNLAQIVFLVQSKSPIQLKSPTENPN